MADKFKKIDKEFLLTDSSVNSYGFRLLTAGYKQKEFEKNPIGYYMHERDNGVLVKWENLRSEGDKIYGKPCINLSNPRGQQTVDEIESGFLNAASFGHFVVEELSHDDSMKIEGQTGPTVTKWFNRECSLVDIPGNFNSLKLYDKDESPINLADFSKHNIQNMKQFILSTDQLSKLNLKAESTQPEIDSVINDLVAKSKKVDGLLTDLASEKTAKETAETALKNLKETTTKTEVETEIATGLSAKKFTNEVAEQLKKDYAGKPVELKALIANMQPYASITDAIDKTKVVNAKLADMSWEELDKAGKLENLKASDLGMFKTKYKEKFSKEYEEK